MLPLQVCGFSGASESIAIEIQQTTNALGGSEVSADKNVARCRLTPGVNVRRSPGVSRGAVGATVETYSFQARPFCERLGYEVFGTLDGYPPGHIKFFLRKAF